MGYERRLHRNANILFSRSEIERIRTIYSLRNYDSDPAYSCKSATYRIRVRRVEREMLNALTILGLINNISNMKVLDFGCGNGLWLTRWLSWGATSGNLSAADIREEALQLAQNQAPKSKLCPVRESGLEMQDESCDIVYQNLVFSSILEAKYRKAAGSEIARVIKPGGVLFWYDLLYNNPLNRNIRKVPLSEVRDLFPGYEIAYQSKIILAPPIARLVTPFSSRVADFFENISLLRTHLFIALRKPK